MSSLPSKRPLSLWAAGFCPAVAMLLYASLALSLPETAPYTESQLVDQFFQRFRVPTAFALVAPNAFAQLQDGQSLSEILKQSAEETLGYEDGRGELSYSIPVGGGNVTRVTFDAATSTLSFYPAGSPSFLFRLSAFVLVSPCLRIWTSGSSLTVIVADESRHVLLRFTLPATSPDPEKDISVVAFREPQRRVSSAASQLDDSSTQSLYRNLVSVPQIARDAEASQKQIALEAAMQVFSAVLRGQVGREEQYLEARAEGLDPREWILKDFLRAYIVALHAMLETVNLAAAGLPASEREDLLSQARLLASALLMRPYMALSDESSLEVIDRIIASPSPTKLAELRSLILQHELLAEFTALWNQLGRHLSISPRK